MRVRENLRPTVGAFFLARYSVTCGRYLEFLNDRSHHSEEQACRRAPRTAPGGCEWTWEGNTFSLGPWSADEPVVNISLEDAEEYARWHTKRFGRGTWLFRLPTEDEWEKAARGVDGRIFPWGDRFDPAFAATVSSRSRPVPARKSVMERVGLFPADESPYGIRDMDGVARNCTSTRTRDGLSFIAKGGAWSLLDVHSRAAYRFGFLKRMLLSSNGMRLAASLLRR